MKNTNIIKVMEDGGVRVPSIQRDYVMGRPIDDVDKKIRTSLEFFFKAVFDGEEDPLYFVYGLREENGKPLMLLDGQQRLTTLVLLAWFLDRPRSAEKKGRLVENWKFEYETRRIANDFMVHLFRDTILTDKDRTDPWNTIERSDWYLPEMDADATVASVHKVLNLMGEMYKSRGAPPLPDVRKALERICFSCEDMMGDVNKSSNAANDSSFDQIFLKMNARGLPLTAWEKAKSVLDNRGDGIWKHKIDGTWPEKLWKTVGEDIQSLDCAMRKIVIMAIRRQMWNLPAGKINCQDKWLCALAEMKREDDASLASVETGFWKDCKRYFEHVANGDFANKWSYDRCRNVQWGEVPNDNIDGECLRAFLARQTCTLLELLRFDLITTDEYGKAEERSRRVLLNVLDSVSAAPEEEMVELSVAFRDFLSGGKLSELKTALEEIRNNMRARDKISQMETMLNQLEQEIYKSGLKDDQKIKELERNPLVFQSRIAFLLWGEKPSSADGLESRLNELKTDVESKKKWIDLYCDILNNMDYQSKDRLSLDRKIAIPGQVKRRWAELIFDDSDIAHALGKLKTQPTKEKYPPWLKHLKELFKSYGVPGWALKCDWDGWTYICPGEKKITDNAIRLDYSDVERAHRLSLLEPGRCILNGDHDAIEQGTGVKGLPRNDYPNKDVYYNVNDESWWQDAGIPKPMYTKPLENKNAES